MVYLLRKFFKNFNSFLIFSRLISLVILIGFFTATNCVFQLPSQTSPEPPFPSLVPSKIGSSLSNKGLNCSSSSFIFWFSSTMFRTFFSSNSIILVVLGLLLLLFKEVINDDNS